jgi:hypothetical protein
MRGRGRVGELGDGITPRCHVAGRETPGELPVEMVAGHVVEFAGF